MSAQVPSVFAGSEVIVTNDQGQELALVEEVKLWPDQAVVFVRNAGRPLPGTPHTIPSVGGPVTLPRHRIMDRRDGTVRWDGPARVQVD